MYIRSNFSTKFNTMFTKHLFTLLFSMSIFFQAYSVTYTSTANGNWTSPTTWTPMGVPIPGDDAIINHNVILNTSYAYTSGSITVNTSASLVQDVPSRDIWLNGASATFTNNGTITIRNMLLSAGTFNNTGVLTFNSAANFITMNNPGGINCIDSLYNDGTINNNGVINVVTFFNNDLMNNYGTIQGLSTVVDSLWNEGDFFNFLGATLLADSATNNGNFTNNGNVQFFQFTNFVNGVFVNDGPLSFTDMTNMGDFTNNSTITGANNMWNNEIFDNSSTGQITLTTSFLNADSVNNTASFNNDGSFDIGDSFYNFNTITGSSSGSFTVQDSSVNFGTMSGNFDFCDATPPATAPFVDFNFGTIDPFITYCTVSIAENSNKINISFYPNPTKGMVFFGEKYQLEIYNTVGQLLQQSTSQQLNITAFPSGIYLLVVKDLAGTQLAFDKLIKE